MNRTLSGILLLTICIILIGLYGCNDHKKNDNGDDRGGYIPYDTARARKSIISLEEAVTYQNGFINSRAELSKLLKDTGYLTKNFNLPNAESFTRDAIIALLNQKGADGIRLYYGKDKEGRIRLVILPVTREGKDIYTKLITRRYPSDSTVNATDTVPAQAGGVEEADAMENGQTCPPCIMKRFETQF